MLLRISLVVAILAGAGGLYVSHFQVAEKLRGLTTELDDTKKGLMAAQGTAAKASAEAKKAKEEADKATKALAESESALQETRKNYNEQRARADGLFTKLTEATKSLNEAHTELARWRAPGVSVDQIVDLRDSANRAAKERDAFAEENKILLRNLNQTKAELDSLVGTKPYEPPLPPGLKGKILAVDPRYDFVVLDIGTKQGVIEKGQMLVNRDGKLVGKVRITKVEPNRSIANILPEWKQGDVQEGDQVLY
ncbi:MAG: hypothetical protein FJ398_09215 [Verrucomicrobia bacterium]|nr:hypothetical protein [Verrucomicrobiota bacterium]